MLVLRTFPARAPADHTKRPLKEPLTDDRLSREKYTTRQYGRETRTLQRLGPGSFLKRNRVRGGGDRTMVGISVLKCEANE